MALGNEEQLLHDALCQCEASIRHELLSTPAITSSKAQSHIHDKRVQEKLAQLRRRATAASLLMFACMRPPRLNALLISPPAPHSPCMRLPDFTINLYYPCRCPP